MTAPARRLTVLYFAWLRERIGLPREAVETDAATVAELVTELAARDERYALAFSDLKAVRVTRNRAVREPPLGGLRGVAFCPPMTGG